MLLSLDEVIKDYYNPELIKLYRRILEDLDFRVASSFSSKYIYSGCKKFNYLKFDNRNIVLVDEYLEFATNNKIIFNPIDDNQFSCSFLTLNDGIHHKLSMLLNDVFESVIGNKLKIYKGKGTIYQYHEDIDKLPLTHKYIFYKWKNLYNIIASNLTFKNIISFSFEYSNNYQSAYVRFEYPLYNYLF